MDKQYRVLTKRSMGEIYRIIDDPEDLIPTGNGKNQPIRCTDKKMVYCHHCCIKLHYMSLPQHLKTKKHKTNEPSLHSELHFDGSDLSN